MANAVFIQNVHSGYDDQPGQAYHFPRNYLGRVEKTRDDWVILYEGKAHGGRLGYVAIAKVADIVPDRARLDHFYALYQPGSYIEFETVVPRADPATGIAFESSLRGPDGRPTSGGANTSSVRLIDPETFARIVSLGLAPRLDGADALPREGPLPSLPEMPEMPELSAMAGFAEAQAPFSIAGGPELDEKAGVTLRGEDFDPADLARALLDPVERDRQLLSRPRRNAAFARNVKRAYGGRCAMTGLALRNGAGRPEVEAAHIKPVEHGGPDIVQNGLALSGTVHWMFDRGLVAVADDMSILVSRNKVPADIADRLFVPDRKLRLPQDPRAHPHPAFLRWHRENVYGAS